MMSGYANAATNIGHRSYQEDRYLAIKLAISKEESGWLLAVMDGHSGSAEVAEFCEKNLTAYFGNLLDPVFEYTDANLERILKNTILALHEATKDMTSGSTISIVYVSETKTKAFVAILGDSPVIIKGNDGLWVSPEHNIRTNSKDRAVVLQRGAEYSGGYMCDPRTGSGLQLTRSLGDAEFSRFLIRGPETFSVELDESSFIIIATDGLVDPGHSDQKALNNLLEIIERGGTATDLINDALKRRTGDNVTAVLWKQPKSQ